MTNPPRPTLHLPDAFDRALNDEAKRQAESGDKVRWKSGLCGENTAGLRQSAKELNRLMEEDKA